MFENSRTIHCLRIALERRRVRALILFAAAIFASDSANAQINPANAKINFRDPMRAYQDVAVGARVFHVESQLMAEAPEIAAQALVRLNANIDLVLAVFPEHSRANLNGVRFLVLYGPNATGGGRDNGLEYFRAQQGKNADHLDPRWDNSIVIYCADNYAKISDLWAAKSVAHEFAHAYHLQQWPEKQPEILDAYHAAMERGLYRQVRSDKGEVLPEAYATVNQLEYFAELSCMYFVGCNYQPYNQRELMLYDPTGYAMIETMWKVGDYASDGKQPSSDTGPDAPEETKQQSEPRVAGRRPEKAEETLRVWSDASGKSSIAAKFAGMIGTKVRLEKADGIRIAVDISSLSDDDRKWIEDRRR